ncbi:nitric oxide reductase activation protein NorD [Pusillimonas sp.]|uniref:nitric oxide reductase activation protein NorD n=1 Tax=Pusillimonas sp. TaxID=3040095 RepID=UPI0037C9CEE2
MAEAEDVLQDAARHATTYARSLWLKHRGPANQPRPIVLAQVAERLDLLISAVFEQTHALRLAQPPAPPTMLTRLFRRHDVHQWGPGVPATDGHSIWLPVDVTAVDMPVAISRYRAMALQQATRAVRGSALYVREAQSGALTQAAGQNHTPGQDALLKVHNPSWAPTRLAPIVRAVYVLLEAQAADMDLLQRLPGAAADIANLRQWVLETTLAKPPSLSAVGEAIQALKLSALRTPPAQAADGLPYCATPELSLSAAHDIALRLASAFPHKKLPQRNALLHDAWTGDLYPTNERALLEQEGTAFEQDPNQTPPRSARMPRRPKERKPDENEDEKRGQGTWMVQTGPPLEQAEDPRGMQRPVDRDEDTPAEEFADALSELNEARLVSTPGAAKEVLLSDDPPEKRSLHKPKPVDSPARTLHYPEWDHRQSGYRHPGAAVHLLSPQPGPQKWVNETLEQYQTVLEAIRKRFEALRAERLWLRRQMDGNEIDLDAYIEGRADLRAGLPMPQGLYRTQRPESRDLAITLLIDISGSTDSWLTANKRIIDVEREALLLVCIALDRLGAPYSILAFSGEGPQGVTVTEVKAFAEPYSNDIALRIAALDAQHYTRAGAAMRHATAALMKQHAQHRLLLLLSDGKPNDVDQYEGRYGVEDMKKAVDEAKMQGIFPFCLTIDRHAAGYLQSIFGLRQYALLPRAEALPTVLLDWMRKLVAQ